MKYLLALVCCVIAVLPLHAEGDEKRNRNGAHISFEQTEMNLGEISRKGENKRCVFRFVNDGVEPLVILSATTTCSCLKADFSRKPVAVGDSGEIILTLESKKVENGIFHRIVQIRSTSTSGTEILTIKGVSKD